MAPRTLQTRILALFLLLMLAVQIGGFVLIDTVGVTAARKSTGESLVAGEQLFRRLLAQDGQRLAQGARLLPADAAFRDALGKHDRAALAAVLAAHAKRIDAPLLMLVDADGRMIASTIETGTSAWFAFPRLLTEVRAKRQAMAVVPIGGQLHQLVVVPGSGSAAAVAVGFPVDDALARQMRDITRADVTFLARMADGSWTTQGTTLAGDARQALVAAVAGGRLAGVDDLGNASLGEDVVSRVVFLPSATEQGAVAVLQLPVAAGLEPFRQLQSQLAWVSALAVMVSILASILIARGITRPVRELAIVARRIASGDYSAVPPGSRTREIGDLALAFRSMQERISSRESRIMDLAYRDNLTGLPNRALYIERLEAALVEAVDKHEPVAVLLMDLDHFKYVNDTLGHPIGDLLLSEVATRLVAAVKGQASTVARLGGDEFAVLLPDQGAPEALRVAQAVCRALETPMSLEGHVVDVRASVGVAVFPDHGLERSTLLRHADVAMYAAKRNNTGSMLWDARYDEHSHERLSLMSDLRKAVDQDQLTIMYQPKVALNATPEQSLEALVRWHHPDRGLVPPSEFIPFAEQTGYIRAITQWVLARAVQQCAQWRDEGLLVNVSINISARDLMDSELPDRFAALLAEHRCAAAWITLEITESAILDDPGHAMENLDRLNALGCKIAIDDYGTGYASLAYLRRLPLHELKIDKSFVTGMVKDPSDAVIVRSTIDLAHHMGLVVVAEGVEDFATLEKLRALSCDMVQGYALSRALAACDVMPWMRSGASARVVREAALRRVV